MAAVGTAPPPTRTCPKCAHACEESDTTCPRCQVIFDKIADAEERRREAEEQAAAAAGNLGPLERLSTADQLMVRQQVERWEAFTGFEQANNYSVLDGLGNPVCAASEESNVFARQFLKSMRPMTLHIATSDGQPFLTVTKPFRFFFCEVQIHDAGGMLLGTVTRRWSLVNRKYTVVDATGGREYEIFGPFFRPWTFQVLDGEVQIGTIRKQWSGLLKEMFTDADVFGIEFAREASSRLKAVLLGAVFLVDFMHFEDNHNNG